LSCGTFEVPEVFDEPEALGGLELFEKFREESKVENI
jgi:hypothetical protein